MGARSMAEGWCIKMHRAGAGHESSQDSAACLAKAVLREARYYGSGWFLRATVQGILLMPERMVNLTVIDSAALASKS